MPVPMDDLQRMMDGAGEGLGAPYIPLTFPTVTVRNNMQTLGVIASNAEVDRLWTAYKKVTTEDGLRPFHDPQLGGNTPVLLAVEKETGFARAKVSAFLNGLYKAVNEQGWGWRWLDPAGAEHAEQGGYSLNPIETLKTVAKDVGQAAGDLIKPSLDPVTNLVKYGALVVVGGAVIYGLYHGTKIFKATRKARGKG